MESRLGQHKPDKALKNGVVQARRNARKAKQAQGMVVTASLAATMLGWALLSNGTAQIATTVQTWPLPDLTALISAVQQSAGASSVSAANMAVMPGTAAGSQDVPVTNAPAPITITRSSR